MAASNRLRSTQRVPKDAALAVAWADATTTGYASADTILREMARLARCRRDGRWIARSKPDRFLRLAGDDEDGLSWSLWVLYELGLVTRDDSGEVPSWTLNVGAPPDMERFNGRPIVAARTDTRRPTGYTGWARLSDELDEHPKVINLLDTEGGVSAMALWMLAFAWLSRTRRTERSDRVPLDLPEKKLPGAGDRAARCLVAAGLWIEVDGGWRFDESDDLFVWGPIEERRAKIPVRIRELVYERDGRRCVACGSPDDLSLDHIVPWSRGGADDESNLQTMCRPCNSGKGARV